MVSKTPQFNLSPLRDYQSLDGTTCHFTEVRKVLVCFQDPDNFNHELYYIQMREFLETYNKMSEQCFNRCVVSLHDRGLSEEEQSCADLCTEINVKVNHKVLDSFMVEQPRINQEK